METLTYNGESFTVDHAAQGADYIHGYDAAGVLIVAFGGVTDFSGFTYSGTYMSPSDCLGEACNDVKYCGGGLKTRGGDQLMPGDFGALPSSGGALYGDLRFDKRDPRVQIEEGRSGTRLGLCAGPDADRHTSGASVFVYQNDAVNEYGSADNQGCFVLNTGEVDGKQHSLFGNPNGDLIWSSFWINPPMVPGYEYRTIERFNGNPVFVKVVDCGKMPSTTEKSIAHGITGATTFLSVRAMAGITGGTQFELTKCEGDSIKVSGANVVIRTLWNAQDYQSYAFLKYVKD